MENLKKKLKTFSKKIKAMAKKLNPLERGYSYTDF